jgi:hypothetical protein
MDRKGFHNYSEAVSGIRPRQPMEEFCPEAHPEAEKLVRGGAAILHQRLDGGQDFEMVVFQHERPLTDAERLEKAREELKMIAFSAKFDGNGDCI